MENKTPNYAQWTPGANGYVYNGSVVQAEPKYDDNGNFQNTIETPSTVQQTTKQAQTGADFTLGGQSQANTEGSGTDTNADMTAIGSIGSFGENTAKSTTGVLDTNATKSPNANIEPQTELEEYLKDYDYMVATDNIKGQIDALTAISKIDGIDRSTQIAELYSQRTQKIMNIDNQYASQYSQYMAMGDTQNANKVLAEQTAWRQSVGYADAIGTFKTEREKELEAIDWEYEPTYIRGLNDIMDYIGQQFGVLINFQYNPATDNALINAQNQAISRIQERSASTGMYYSSQTQYAITKACAELVPIYEKMAKDEIKSNLELMQNTASFLMKMEQAQFDMWKGQLNVKLTQLDKKRQEIKDAWEKVELQGYVDNESALILDVVPGSLAPSVRKAVADRQAQVDAEERQEQLQEKLAEFKEGLTRETYRRKAEIDAKYATTGTPSSLPKTTYKYNSDGTVDYSVSGSYSGLPSEEQIKQWDEQNKKIAETQNNEYFNGTSSLSTVKNNAISSYTNGTAKSSIIDNMARESKSIGDTVSAIKGATYKDALGQTQYLFDVNLFDSFDGSQLDKINKLMNYYQAIESEAPIEYIDSLNEEKKEGQDNVLVYSQGEKKRMFNHYLEDNVISQINLGRNENDNVTEIANASLMLKAALMDRDEDTIVNNYKKVIDTIAGAGSASSPFDFRKDKVTFNSSTGSIINMSGWDAVEEKTPFDKGDRSKQLAIVYLLNELEQVLPESVQSPSGGTRIVKGSVMKQLSQYLLDKSTDGTIKGGYSGLTNKNSYKYLK